MHAFLAIAGLILIFYLISRERSPKRLPQYIDDLRKLKLQNPSRFAATVHTIKSEAGIPFAGNVTLLQAALDVESETLEQSVYNIRKFDEKLAQERTKRLAQKRAERYTLQDFKSNLVTCAYIVGIFFVFFTFVKMVDTFSTHNQTNAARNVSSSIEITATGR